MSKKEEPRQTLALEIECLVDGTHKSRGYEKGQKLRQIYIRKMTQEALVLC